MIKKLPVMKSRKRIRYRKEQTVKDNKLPIIVIQNKHCEVLRTVEGHDHNRDAVDSFWY